MPFETSVLESSTFVASSCSEKNCVSRQFRVGNLVLEKLDVVANIVFVSMLVRRIDQVLDLVPTPCEH